MLNEDDTFKKLKRTPYHEIEHLYTRVWNEIPVSFEGLKEKLAEHGWTWEEFIEIWKFEFK